MQIRPLISPEVAFTETNDHYPLCITVALFLADGPAPDVVRQALDRLQERHLMLNMAIERQGNQYWFVRLTKPKPIPLSITDRLDGETWRTTAEQALNTHFPTDGPLLRAVYLPPNGAERKAELILALHHGFIDSRPLRVLLDELLRLCGGLEAPPRDRDGRWGRLPEVRLSPVFQGWSLWRRLSPFLGRQMLDEWYYQRKGVGAPVPDASRNAIISLSLSETDSRRLLAAAGRRGLNLNSVLGAALLLAMVKGRHGAHLGSLFRAIAFADLRPYLDPAPAEDDFGCFVSMLRFTLPVEKETSLEEVARELQRQMYRAGRRNELQLFALLSKHMLRMAIRLQRLRLANTALSFMGKLDLQPVYGDLQLEDVRAYITNNRLGPEYSGFGKVLFGRIGLDLTYLTAEMDARQAREIVDEIHRLLGNFH